MRHLLDVISTYAQGQDLPGRLARIIQVPANTSESQRALCNRTKPRGRLGREHTGRFQDLLGLWMSSDPWTQLELQGSRIVMVIFSTWCLHKYRGLHGVGSSSFMWNGAYCLAPEALYTFRYAYQGKRYVFLVSAHVSLDVLGFLWISSKAMLHRTDGQDSMK